MPKCLKNDIIVKESQMEVRQVRISDAIESFIKEMLLDTDDSLQLQRNQLAEKFGCAPSQINYVLATRFTEDHGYVIKSKRGGGGCIIIYKVEENLATLLSYLLNERVGNSICESDCEIISNRLQEKGLITPKEKSIICKAVSNKALGIIGDCNLESQIRAKIFREILLELFSSIEVNRL